MKSKESPQFKRFSKYFTELKEKLSHSEIESLLKLHFPDFNIDQSDIKKQFNFQNNLISLITLLQKDFLKKGFVYGWCDDVLKSLLNLTNSEFGFICELQKKEDGTPFIKSHGVTNISWNEETKKFYHDNIEKGLEFFNFKSIWGHVMTTGESYISKNPDTDPYRGGYPKEQGHPPLKSFLGLPIKDTKENIVGIIAVANNPHGYDQKLIDMIAPFVKTYGMLIEKDRLDIQEKRTKEKAEKSEMRFRNIVENSTNVFYSHTADHEITYVSPKINKILGYGPEELMKEWTSFITDNPINKEGFEKTEKAIKTGKRQPTYLLELRHKDGKNIMVEVREEPIVKNGKVESIVGSLSDVTDLIKAEQELNKSELQFEILMKNSPICNKKLDLDFNLQFMNQAGIDQLKIKDVNEFYDKPYPFYFFPEAFKQAMRDALEKVKKTAKETQIEGILTDTKGNEKWYNHILVPIKNDAGQLDHFWVLSTDISERKKLENTKDILVDISNMILTTKNLEEFFHQIFIELSKLVDTNNFYIALYDEQSEMISTPFIADKLDSNITDFPAKNTMTGYVIKTQKSMLINQADFHELVKNGVIDLVGPPSDVWIGVPLFRNGKVIGVIVIQNYEGEKRLSREDLIVLEYVAPQISFAIERKNIVEDLKNALEKAEESENRFRHLFKDLGDAVFVTVIGGKNNGKILEVNAAAIKQTGYSRAELLQMNVIRDLLVSDTGEISTDDWNKKLLNGETVKTSEIKRKKNGLEYWTEVIVTPIEYKGKRASLSVNRDITERKIAEEELTKAKEKAEESDRLKSAFLANMSHEIRTPMNGILGFTDLLSEVDFSGDEKDKYITVIQNSGNRLLNTVDDIIDISKIEAGQMEVSSDEINLSELTEQLKTFFGLEARKKGLELILEENTKSQNTILKSDKEKINAIFTNLIKNAIKYTASGKIEFGYQKIKNEILFFVKDTGIGISKNGLKVIFDRFRRISNEEGYFSEGGSGLGLAITKAYVDMLGGKIWVESEKGAGTQFYFTIPYEAVDDESSSKKMVSEAKGQTKLEVSGLKILIAEDDESSFEYLEVIIENISSEIIHVLSGIEAVKQLKNHSDIDLVLMDINMPGMDGYEATAEIRKFNKEVLIIAQTAYALAGDQEKAIEAGCDDYISKPIKKAVLLEKINKSLGKK